MRKNLPVKLGAAGQQHTLLQVNCLYLKTRINLVFTQKIRNFCKFPCIFFEKRQILTNGKHQANFKKKSQILQKLTYSDIEAPASTENKVMDMPV
jgi:hypothetical protein